MQQGARFQEHARLGRQAVHRLQFVEELTAQFAHVLGVLLIEFQASRKTASAHEQLPGRRVVAVGFFAGKGIASDFVQEAFAQADARNRK